MLKDDRSSLDRSVHSLAVISRRKSTSKYAAIALYVNAGIQGVHGLIWLTLGIFPKDHNMQIMGLSIASILLPISFGLVYWGNLFTQRERSTKGFLDKLSPEGRSLLQMLIERTDAEKYARNQLSGSIVPPFENLPPIGNDIFTQFGRSKLGRMLGMSKPNCAELIPHHAFVLLNEAAKEYNRLQAACAYHAPNATSPLKEFLPEIKEAADITMAQMFHLAAMLTSYPEGSNRAEAHHFIQLLASAADEVENAKSNENFVTQTPSEPELETVLKQLHRAVAASEELDQTSQTQQKTYRSE